MNASGKFAAGVWLVVFISIALTAGAAHAAIPGVPAIGYDTYTEGSFSGGDVTLGWEFTITQPVGVTGLGYYDYASNGLVSSHDVGIFNLSGTLLVSATVASGTVEELRGDNTYSRFRYHPVGEFPLSAGTYRVAGTAGAVETSNDSPSGLYTNSPVVFPLGLPYYANNSPSGALTYPATNENPNTRPWSGPNFLFVVPEPSSLAVLAVSAAALARRRRWA